MKPEADPKICFVVDQEAFANHLQWVLRGVSSRPVLPVYGNILILADQESQTLTLWGTDLNTWTTATVNAVVKEGCLTTIAAKLLYDIISNAPEGNVMCSVEKEGLFRFDFATGGSYVLRGSDAKDFEPPPFMDEGTELKIPLQGFLDGLKATLYCFSTEESKQILQGVHVKIDYSLTESEEWQCDLEFAATDGHRMGLHSSLHTQKPEAVADVEENSTYEYTVPGKALREVQRMLDTSLDTEEEEEGGKKKKPDVAVSIETVTIRHDTGDQSGEYIAFVMGKRMLITRTLQGQYPNYNQLVPKAFEQTLQLERRLFLRVLERVQVIADQKQGLVKLTLNPTEQTLIAQAEVDSIGNAKEEMPAQISGSAMTIILNIKYLKEAVKSAATTDILISMNHPLKPIVVQPVRTGVVTSRHIALSMPVQARD